MPLFQKLSELLEHYEAKAPDDLEDLLAESMSSGEINLLFLTKMGHKLDRGDDLDEVTDLTLAGICVEYALDDELALELNFPFTDKQLSDFLAKIDKRSAKDEADADAEADEEGRAQDEDEEDAEDDE